MIPEEYRVWCFHSKVLKEKLFFCDNFNLRSTSIEIWVITMRIVQCNLNYFIDLDSLGN